MLMGLAAKRLHHCIKDSALFALLRACEPGTRELGLGLCAVSLTHDAIVAADLSPTIPPAP